MIILATYTEESTPIAKKTRDLLSETGELVILVPHGTTGVFITIDEDTNEFIVYANDGLQDLDVVKGFSDLDESWAYARLVAHAAGLTEEDIMADVYETH
jgi:hypothetical protein